MIKSRLNAWLLALVLGLPAAMLHAEDSWQLQRAEQGIQVFTAPQPGSSIDRIRAVTRIKADPGQLTVLIADPEQRSLWDEVCTRSYTHTEAGESSDLLGYYFLDMPWPVADRDMLARITTQTSGNGRVESIKIRAVADPMARQDGVVRIVNAFEHWQIRVLDQDTLELEVIAHADPEGPLPGWLINWLAVESPISALTKLRKIAQAAPADTQ